MKQSDYQLRNKAAEFKKTRVVVKIKAQIANVRLGSQMVPGAIYAGKTNKRKGAVGPSMGSKRSPFQMISEKRSCNRGFKSSQLSS